MLRDVVDSYYYYYYFMIRLNACTYHDRLERHAKNYTFVLLILYTIANGFK